MNQSETSSAAASGAKGNTAVPGLLQEAAGRAGVDGADARLLRHGSNALYLLPHAGLVARVGRPGTFDIAQREVRIAEWLAGQGLRVNTPAPGIQQPILVEDRPVTWWLALAEHRDATTAELAGVLRALNRPNGGSNRALVRRSINAYGISTAHFVGQGHQRGRTSPSRRSAAEILRRLEPGSARAKTSMLRRALDESGVPRVCDACGVGDTWRGKRLVLEIDHING
jgi:hypothetical protein